MRKTRRCDFNAQIKTIYQTSTINTSSLDRVLIWAYIRYWVFYFIGSMYYRICVLQMCVGVLPYYRNITVYCSFTLQCNILQSVMYYSVILQYGSNLAVFITSIVTKYCISVDEKFLSFQNIVICTNLTNLVFLPTLRWSCNFNDQIRR